MITLHIFASHSIYSVLFFVVFTANEYFSKHKKTFISSYRLLECYIANRLNFTKMFTADNC